MGILIIVGLIFLFIVFVVSIYNALIRKRNMVKDQWAQIDVLLKRRADLIPNLVETVKGYASHEKETFENVTAARAKVVGAPNPTEELKANGELTQALGRLMVVAEAYPELKANQNFLDLQSNLRETEDKIAYARQFYNDAVLVYKNKIEMFPSNFIASMFGFKPEPFFEASEQEKETPQVKF